MSISIIRININIGYQLCQCRAELSTICPNHQSPIIFPSHMNLSFRAPPSASSLYTYSHLNTFDETAIFKATKCLAQ